MKTANISLKKTCVSDCLSTLLLMYCMSKQNNAYNTTSGKTKRAVSITKSYKVIKMSTYWWAYKVHCMFIMGV